MHVLPHKQWWNYGRVVASGEASDAPPHIKNLCPHLMFDPPWLQHISNDVFKKRCHPCGFGPCCEILATGLT